MLHPHQIWAPSVTGKHYHCLHGSAATRLPRTIVTYPALAARVRRHVHTPLGRLIVSAHGGPRQTVVFLSNCTGSAVKKASLEIRVPKPPQSAYAGRTEKLPFTVHGGRVKLTLDLGVGDVDISVLRF